MDHGIGRILCLHGFLFFLSGIPVLYSGDEIGQVNDYTYKDNPEKAADSRYIHRGRFHWELTGCIKDGGSVQGRIFSGLKQMEELRRGEPLFGADARFSVRETWDDSVLCLVREQEQGKLVGIFNFHDYERIAWIDETDGMYQDMMTGEMLRASAVRVDGHGFRWLKRAEAGS